MSAEQARVGYAAAKIAELTAERDTLAEAVERDAVADVLGRHRYALGYEGILADGEYAWLQCTCGYKENVWLRVDDITIAEAAWEQHLADAISRAALTPPDRRATDQRQEG